MDYHLILKQYLSNFYYFEVVKEHTSEFSLNLHKILVAKGKIIF